MDIHIKRNKLTQTHLLSMSSCELYHSSGYSVKFGSGLSVVFVGGEEAKNNLLSYDYD